MTSEQLDFLKLPPRVSTNTDSHQTAFTVSIDAAPHLGVTTGASALDRSRIKIISIADLISYRLKHDRFVRREAVADLPTEFGSFQIYGYRNTLDNSEAVAIVKGAPNQFAQQPILVRIHSECLIGDAFGSLRCDCRPQLQSALKMIENAGTGVLVYLRKSGRGIGLINKLKTYWLQDLGLDTVDANEKLGFEPDLRSYGVGAQILKDMSVYNIRLLTNNPRKVLELKGCGLNVVERVPLVMKANFGEAETFIQQQL